MAGIGIRFFETARALSRDFDVLLGIPNSPGEVPGPVSFRTARYTAENLRELCAGRDAVLLHGHVSEPYLALGLDLPLVVDLYDPFPIENLNYFPVLGEAPYWRDRAALAGQMRRGDLFLCSSEEQRLFYLGALYGEGRLNPPLYFEDFRLRNLIRIVPFGVPEEPPEPGTAVLRGVVPGIGERDPIVFFGGVYDWYDPMLLVRALEELVAQFPDLRVVFCANPNPDSTPQGVHASVLRASRDRGWEGRHVFFVPWVPYLRRGQLYRECTLAVATHRIRFETEVSLRTRVLDFLWAGLPAIVTEGGPLSRTLREDGLAIVLAEGDLAGLAGAIRRLLSDKAYRAELARKGRAWASARTWGKVLEPLAEFLAAPRRDATRERFVRRDGPAGIPEPSLLSRLRRRLGRAG